MRAAVYYAPDLSDPLWDAAAAWLGRDPETGAACPQPELPGIAGVTNEPRLYGFHATLKPPMALRAGWDEFATAADALARSIAPFALPPLAVADMSGFLALRETVPCPPLHALADACVVTLDEFRVPADPAELARRRGAGLPPAAEAMLVRWGYPYVLETWRFHMTLTRRLPPEDRAFWLSAAERHLAAALAEPRAVTDICLFTQAAPGAPFMLAERLALRG